MNDLDQLVSAAEAEFDAAPTPAELENAKARFLGKSGRVTDLLKGLAALPPEQKKARGAEINQLKARIEAALQSRRESLAESELQAQLRAEALDITLPGRRRGTGGLHPVSRTIERIEAIFGSMGFDVAEGPEIETDWMNFTALNSPKNHPARSMQDTFYVDLKDAEGAWLNLRTHTSPMQVRYAMAHAQKYKGVEPMPEIRVIAPGRTYRVDSDATHSPMFHQIEGLWVDEGVSLADLKGTVTQFCRAFFERDDIAIRFRPSYFPFVEPGVEIDMEWERKDGEVKYLEIGGAGVVHPDVLRNGNIDPERYSGFAFGMGLDRLAMLKYGVNDLRLFFDNDLKFLRQFR